MSDKQVYIVEMFDFSEEEAMKLLNERFAELPREKQLIKTSHLTDIGVQKLNKHVFEEGAE